LSGASQANISFITEAGHRISSDDIVGAMLDAFGDNSAKVNKRKRKLHVSWNRPWRSRLNLSMAP
jgi:hypothetical protein